MGDTQRKEFAPSGSKFFTLRVVPPPTPLEGTLSSFLYGTVYFLNDGLF